MGKRPSWSRACPLASVVANPISGVVLDHFGWQMMFVVEALPGLVWALVWIWAITEEPKDAAWLDGAAPTGTTWALSPYG